MTTFQQNTDETPVVFRKMRPSQGGEVLALFVAEAGNYDGYTIGCYAHVGQHGQADYRHCIDTSRPATPEEYADLKHELESTPYGYRLKIYQKQTHAHRDAVRNFARRAS